MVANLGAPAALDQRSYDAPGAIRRAREAVIRLVTTRDAVNDPLLVVALDMARAAGCAVDLAVPLGALQARVPAYGGDNACRYRWDLSWRSEPGSSAYRLPPHIPPPRWRQAEEQQAAAYPSAHGRRLMEPIIIAAQFGFWGGVATDPATPPNIARRASALLDEATPVAENDLARWFAARDPWRDTFGLWRLTATSGAMARLRDHLFSLALRYGTIAQRDGKVLGTKYPFFGRPLVSASAQLAGGLWRCGIYPSLIPPLLSFVSDARGSDGGWADEGQRADLMTTLVAADLLIRLDPDFDAQPTIGSFLQRQEPGGWWRALNPEVPWLTAAIAAWLELAGRPFDERFEWPSAPIWARDRLSGLTTLATLVELERVLDGLPLRRQTLEVAFVDLAGFGAWNSAHGQAKGDLVIELLGRSLAELEGVLPVRIGGDEIMLIGKPGSIGGRLSSAIETWRRAWPAYLADNGVHGVAPRVVLARGRAGKLHYLRTELGRAIAKVKAACPNPPAEGVQQDWQPDRSPPLHADDMPA